MAKYQIDRMQSVKRLARPGERGLVALCKQPGIPILLDTRARIFSSQTLASQSSEKEVAGYVLDPEISRCGSIHRQRPSHRASFRSSHTNTWCHPHVRSPSQRRAGGCVSVAQSCPLSNHRGHAFFHAKTRRPTNNAFCSAGSTPEHTPLTLLPAVLNHFLLCACFRPCLSRSTWACFGTR